MQGGGGRKEDQVIYSDVIIMLFVPPSNGENGSYPSVVLDHHQQFFLRGISDMTCEIQGKRLGGLPILKTCHILVSLLVLNNGLLYCLICRESYLHRDYIYSLRFVPFSTFCF